MRFVSRMTVACLSLFLLGACAKNEHYPDKYVGFAKKNQTLKFNKADEEKEVSFKIIATEKKDEDREVALSCLWDSRNRGNNNRWGTQRKAVCKLLDTKVVIPARKKSATVRLRVFPKRIDEKEVVRIVCSTNDKEVKPSQLTLQLTTK